MQPGVGDGVGHDLGIAGGVEDGALELVLPPQFGGVGQVAVVGQGHIALNVAQNQGLGVYAAHVAGGGVPHMADGDVAFAQFFQAGGGKDVGDQAVIPVAGEDAVVVDRDAAAFLASVLQSVKGEIGGFGDVGGMLLPDTEYAAFLVQIVEQIATPLSH